METCRDRKNYIVFLIFFFLIFFLNYSHADLNFENLEKKKVSYLEFFLLKFENKIINRSQSLRRQAIATRVQYSHVSTKIDFDRERKKIFINIYSIMDSNRYSKKRYKQKLSDCNQVRNLIFYNKIGYRFFTQKRDPTLSVDTMKEIFKDIFFDELNLNDKEKEFMMDRMFVKIIIFHPINKKELICSGNINDYELK